ncbi:MAG: hypothetical protein JWM64_2647, partial [Frankiales bacterium]|nr:hypothetical protein [Frankiales bacterium]
MKLPTRLRSVDPDAVAAPAAARSVAAPAAARPGAAP